MFSPQEITAGIFLLVAVLIYYLNKIPRHKQEKYRLLTKYRRTQNMSLKIQDILSKYVLSNDAAEEVMAPGLSYGDCLKSLQRDYAVHLSKKTFLKISQSNNKRVLRKIDVMLNGLQTKLDETSDMLEGQKKSSDKNSELSII